MAAPVCAIEARTRTCVPAGQGASAAPSRAIDATATVQLLPKPFWPVAIALRGVNASPPMQ